MGLRFSPSCTILTVLALVLLSSACRRTTEDWVADLTAPDEWHRRVAASALASVPDEDVERALRMVLKCSRERSGPVIRALEQTMAALGDRRPDLTQRALATLAPERRPERVLLARILLEQLRRGDESARPVLEAYLALELDSPVTERREAARPLRAAVESIQRSK